MYHIYLQLVPSTYCTFTVQMLNFGVGLNATSCNTSPHRKSRPSNEQWARQANISAYRDTLEARYQVIGLLLTNQIGDLLDSVLDPLIYSVHATACHVHASRLYRKNTLLSPLPSGKHGCHVPMHAQLARPPLFKVTVQGLGTLSSGTPAPGLPMRLCGSTLILIKPHFSGRESRVGGGVVGLWSGGPGEVV